MSKGRKTFSKEFKAKVALEAIKGYKSINELAREYQVHPNAIGNWKKQILEALPGIFENKRGPRTEIDPDLPDQLYKQIGKLQVELDWLKKKFNNIS